MSDHWLILIISAGSWNIWSTVVVGSSPDRVALYIWSKLVMITVVSWSWLIYCFFIHYLSSLGIAVNLETRVLMSNNRLVLVISTWAWYIRCIVIIRSSSNWDTLSILTELIMIVVISWSWLVHLFFVNNLSSLGVTIYLETWALVSDIRFILIIRSWSRNIWRCVIIGSTSYWNLLSILSKLIMITVVTWSG